MGVLSFVLVTSQADDPAQLNETFDFARSHSYRRAVIVMFLQQCWAMLSAAAGAGELHSRKSPPNDRRDSFTLTFQRLGQFSRADGSGSEKS